MSADDACFFDIETCGTTLSSKTASERHPDATALRAAFVHWLESAPEDVRRAIIALLPPVHTAMKRGHRPNAGKGPMQGWRDLLGLLGDVAAMRHDMEPLIRVTNELLGVAEEMVPPEEALRQSAQALVRFFGADLFVCRLRDADGDWRVVASDRPDGGATPIFSPILEEGLAGHPVMRAVCDGTRHVVSNDLRGMDRGGESFDCMAYKAGCRSRLAFVLRERKDRPPFGLVLLYSEQEGGFDGYDGRFLAKCARIVALTTGRRLAVARDALEKAAGAVAHHGNNALAILRNYGELCAELLDDMHEEWEDATTEMQTLRDLLPEDSSARAHADRLQEKLARLDTLMLTEYIDGVLRSSRRIQRIIAALEESAQRPRLMHYVLGRHVLDLGDTSCED